MENEDSTDSLELKITDDQFRSITYSHEPLTALKIVAGPGCGKTHTLIARIVHLLNSEVDPCQILVLSLTNRAVLSLRSRLIDLVGTELAQQVNIQTFHSFAMNVLNDLIPNQYELLGFGGTQMISKLVNVPFLKRKDQITKLLEQQMINRMSSSQKTSSTSSSNLKVQQLVKFLHNTNVLTSSSIISQCTLLLRENSQKLNHRVLIVDEFQDMYPELVQLVAVLASDCHLTVAGDPDQSIYSFLGSTPYVLNGLDKILPHNYSKIETINLTATFRMSLPIIESSQLFSMFKKPLTPVESPAPNYLPKPTKKYFTDIAQEVDFILEEISRLVHQCGGVLKPSDFAILSFKNDDINYAQSVFEKQGIKTQKLGSSPEWTNNELYHFINFLRVINDPGADYPLISCLSIIPGVGHVSLSSLVLKAMSSGSPIFHLLKGVRPVIDSFVEDLNTVRDRFFQYFDDPDEIFKITLEFASKYGLLQAIKSNPNWSQKPDSFYFKQLESIRVGFHMASKLRSPNETLVQYFIAHFADEIVQPTEDAINFSTIHGAKGLEFPVVFLLGATQVSTFRSEETKRLIYVALTRAKQLLYWNKYLYHEDASEEYKFQNVFTDSIPSCSYEYVKYLSKITRRTPPSLNDYHQGIMTWKTTKKKPQLLLETPSKSKGQNGETHPILYPNSVALPFMKLGTRCYHSAVSGLLRRVIK
ncbi:ATP-dependent DNA helicase HMI1, mitochondrial [Komagataella phaffii CBS 7435]|uniref:DNA 3'-5' helicase n=2 Tax=Komagataella phaffii TaxID=460519 RepID=C4QXN6_KOMPG|nr:Mitochondrial inner membrane localized ATP-dependent DNA helicase [Komagataella phaffii GS115]AOA60485.1 GQ67_02006T0 [Komagataella phaffii]CAH2446824.1 ATP-dependent DNA helicase HMI1, mitochondrial [Komagataella phaffii CBS 7435]AOA66617.1 GQ68_02021T0 [Komagataella phaffii GS115]CAY68009.1 Mitochondrial inner membrane localized ATP-dependent DNA helicase [Komagataella phaffii GS115]CCA37084.1 ATP-dependent DNA helicase HMI1, mitochondrial [Komagataella phaffii CBS 7435]